MKVFNKAKNVMENKLTKYKSAFINFDNKCVLMIAEIINLEKEQATLLRNPKSQKNDEKIEKIEKEKIVKMAKMKEKFNRLVKKAEEAFLFYGKKSLELKKKLKP